MKNTIIIFCIKVNNDIKCDFVVLFTMWVLMKFP